MVPSVELPPVVPFTCQVTAVLLIPVTMEVNCCVAPASTFTELGEMPIEVFAVMVTEAEADTEVSACETAVTVTVAGLGTVAGAE